MNNLNPIQWAFRPIKRYADFSGRSSRAEFWWFVLFVMILYVVVMFGLGVVAGVGARSPLSPGAVGAFGIGLAFIGLFWLALIVPTIAVQVRRLHDVNRSGWWVAAFCLLYVAYLAIVFGGAFGLYGGLTSPGGALAAASAIVIIFFVYTIVLLVFFCLRGTRGANRYGDDPYGPDVEQVFA